MTTTTTLGTRWLDTAEMAAWLPLLRVVQLLPRALDTQLRAEAGVNHTYYMILANLSDAPDRRLSMTELAQRAALSQSRLTHAVDSLETRGWVRRAQCPDDGRKQYAALTDAGLAELRELAPLHVAEVRRLVFDALDPDEVEQLRTLSRTILDNLQEETP